jgi:hypothetical protein
MNSGLDRLEVSDQLRNHLLDLALASLPLGIEPLAPHRHIARPMGLYIGAAVDVPSDLIFWQRIPVPLRKVTQIGGRGRQRAGHRTVTVSREAMTRRAMLQVKCAALRDVVGCRKTSGGDQQQSDERKCSSFQLGAPYASVADFRRAGRFRRAHSGTL